MARKKEDIFYTLLKEFGFEIQKTAEDYVELLKGYPETANLIPLMRVHEDRCDECVKKIMEQLLDSFITPFDRDDISELATKLDDVVDAMTGVAVSMELFNTSGTRTEATQMAELTRAAVGEIKVMLDHLPDYKTDRTVLTKAISVGHIENEGDTVYEAALSRLFHEEDLDEYRRGHVVSWMRIFDRMEECLNDCDGAARVVRDVVMKSA